MEREKCSATREHAHCTCDTVPSEYTRIIMMVGNYIFQYTRGHRHVDVVRTREKILSNWTGNVAAGCRCARTHVNAHKESSHAYKRLRFKANQKKTKEYVFRYALKLSIVHYPLVRSSLLFFETIKRVVLFLFVYFVWFFYSPQTQIGATLPACYARSGNCAFDYVQMIVHIDSIPMGKFVCTHWNSGQERRMNGTTTNE